MRKARKHRIARAQKRAAKYYKAPMRKPNGNDPVQRLWWDLNETWLTSAEWLSWLRRHRSVGSRLLRPRPMIVPRYASTIKPVRLP
jgi:hypothetical protein